eukprot:CAMPEP_0174906746 /NCGR_PEP_ID=MMETSP0167-20121228/58233_1 /TAXON_ID=38298 /ORGANISM="Rhodella maculata, Strain CCMP736" /LENGTH=44 /DNA_ID= /DNA_START= /DNA_END= /DNA_ORIENTATION=
MDGSSLKARITDVLDVEENIWSRTFGIKGKIDASVRVQFNDEPG